MSAYFLRRFILIIPTFLGITLIVFTITRFVPGGPIERMLAQMKHQGLAEGGNQSPGSDAPISEEQMQQLKEYYGFDKPIMTGYLEWLSKIVRLDLGRSSRYYDPVWDMIVERLPVSVYYGLMTTLITYMVCIPLGIIKALKHKTTLDNVTSVIVFIGYALPSFIVGIAIMVIFASNLEWFPMGGFMSDEAMDWPLHRQIFDILYHSALPLVAYLVGSFAVMTFLMKNTLMENLAADYVRTAMAKGLEYKRAVFTHALRNSLIPLATHFGTNILLVFEGSFLIEKVFDIPGMGLLGFESMVDRDYPVVLGTLVIYTLLFLIGNIISDICVAFVDPRVRFR